MVQQTEITLKPKRRGFHLVTSEILSQFFASKATKVERLLPIVACKSSIRMMMASMMISARRRQETLATARTSARNLILNTMTDYDSIWRTHDEKGGRTST